MKKLCYLLLCLACVFVNGCFEATVSQPGEQVAATMNRPVVLESDYWLYLPDDYSKEDKSWPLMVFLHGGGQGGNDIDTVKQIGPPMLAAKGKKFPFIIVSPQSPGGRSWTQNVETVMVLIDEIERTYAVDKDRIYLTGLSMGGSGTWGISTMHPDRFAAILPVCGGDARVRARNYKNLPVWAFHGDKDSVASVEQSVDRVKAIQEAGGDAKLTIYPGGNHDAWTETYANDEVYEWLLSHSKSREN